MKKLLISSTGEDFAFKIFQHEGTDDFYLEADDMLLPIPQRIAVKFASMFLTGSFKIFADNINQNTYHELSEDETELSYDFNFDDTNDDTEA